MPPRSSIVKFQDINDDDDGYSPPPPPQPRRKKTVPEPASSPPPSPPPPSQSRRKTVPESDPESVRVTQHIHVYKTSCSRCLNGNRTCEVKEVGKACKGCHAKKYKCEHTGNTEVDTFWGIRGKGMEVENVADRKGKKRKAESPQPPRKKKVTVKVEKVETAKKSRGKVEEKTRERVAEKPKASGSKPPGRRRVAPKSAPIIVDSAEEDDDDDEVMVVDVESDEVAPRPKRVRATTGECPTHF
jgi:hypothetical protein